MGTDSVGMRRQRTASLSTQPVCALGMGAGGVEELRSHVDDANVFWALVRLQVGSGAFVRGKLVAVHFNGDDTPQLRRGRLNARAAEALALLGDVHATLEVKRRYDLTGEALLERLLPLLVSDGDLRGPATPRACAAAAGAACAVSRTGAGAEDAAKAVALCGTDAAHAVEALRAADDGLAGSLNWVLLGMRSPDEADAAAASAADGDAGAVAPTFCNAASVAPALSCSVTPPVCEAVAVPETLGDPLASPGLEFPPSALKRSCRGGADTSHSPTRSTPRQRARLCSSSLTPRARQGDAGLEQSDGLSPSAPSTAAPTVAARKRRLSSMALPPNPFALPPAWELQDLPEPPRKGGSLKLRHGRTWERRHFELHLCSLRWWRSSQDHEAAKPCSELLLVEGLGYQWYVQGSSKRLELVHSHCASALVRSKQSLSRVGYQLEAEDDEDLKGWLSAIRQHILYARSFLVWPLSWDGGHCAVADYSVAPPPPPDAG
eukprot:TRINITY_DN26665_c0_g1_i1.p1 TRINITY_DN26665_c0_g1~~TRINITY_DN26665_c0_g1_i1.p1  ORF type:complete len:492 (+),score=132.32 TRINITY_DN26665_c0_g1_i1:156-1631(+)